MRHVLATRRTVCGALAASVGFPRAFAEEVTRCAAPLLWLATRGTGSVYLFPFGEAKDDSWFTQRVKDAFASSSELWLELGSPLAKDRVDALYQELGHVSGRPLLDALNPRVRARALHYMKELGIPGASVETMRPWLAYYTFVTAFDEKYGHSEGFTNARQPQLPPGLGAGWKGPERPQAGSLRTDHGGVASKTFRNARGSTGSVPRLALRLVRRREERS
jgi:hypothetical protein